MNKPGVDDPKSDGGTERTSPPVSDGASIVQTPPMPMAVDGGAAPPPPAAIAAVPSEPPAPVRSEPQATARLVAVTTPVAPESTPAAASAPSTQPAPAETGWPVRMRLFGRTDVGRIREHNEDNFLVADLSQNARGLMENIRSHVVGAHGTLLAVCDGMGGAAAGEVASKLAVDIIYEQMQSGGPPRHREDLARRLVRAVEVAGLRIFAEAKLDRNRRGMGTTATAEALMDDHLFLAQVGDSRAYLLRGDRLELVTRDQSLVNQLIEAGQLTEEEAENFEHSNIILQALGTADSVQVDLTYVKVRDGDTLMMCSDGLSGMVRAEEIRQVLLHNPEPIDVCKVLTDKANDAGGHDNITVIVAKFEGGPRPGPDEIAKYLKYVFTTDANELPQPPEPSLRPPSARPPLSADATEPPSPSGAVNAKLAATQLGMNSSDLMAQMQQIEGQPSGPVGSGRVGPSSHPPAGTPGTPALVAAPAAGGRSTEAELRAAGLPGAGSMSVWIWLAALVALGLVALGIYALLTGKLPR